MKIAVTISRPWTVAHRYASLLRNAVALGHDVLCIGPKPGGNREELTKQLCDEVGVRLVHPTNTRTQIFSVLTDFNPDIVYSEGINDPFELWAQEWAGWWQGGTRAIGAVLDHTLFMGQPTSDWWIERMRQVPHSILMVTHKDREKECLEAGIKAVAVGTPELDLIHDYGPIPFRGETIALFIGLWWRDRRHLQDDERSILEPFFELARSKGWTVLVHAHGGERVKSFADGPDGLTFPQRYEYLLELQDWGANFVGDYAGNIGYLRFLPINSFELMMSVRCIVGTILSVWWKAAAVRRPYVLLATERTEDYFYKQCGGYVMPMPNVAISRPLRYLPEDRLFAGFSSIEYVLRPGCNEIDHAIEDRINEQYVDRYFMGLDGKTWERMLALATRSRNKEAEP